MEAVTEETTAVGVQQAGLLSDPGDGCRSSTYGGSVYYYCTTPRDWNTARSKCQAAGGDLVKIASVGENDHVESRVGTATPWIGAKDVAANNTFKWVVDNSALIYSIWDTGQPSHVYQSAAQDCVQHGLGTGGKKWNDTACATLLPYVCEQLPPETCDGIDNDTDGTIDEACACRTSGNNAPGYYQPLYMTHFGKTRLYHLYVSNKVTNTKPVPLLIDIHGFGGTPGNEYSSSYHNVRADQYVDPVSGQNIGAVVVYPDGLNDQSWNSGYECCGTSLTAMEHDISFMKALADKVRASHSCIDPKRIYLTGISNGGGMTHSTLCRYADYFAAGAPVSMPNLITDKAQYDNEFGGVCNPSRPVPVFHVHGDADTLVPWQGGDGVTQIPTSTTMSHNAWAGYNGCGTGSIYFDTNVTSPVNGFLAWKNQTAPAGITGGDYMCMKWAGCAAETTLCGYNGGHVPYNGAYGENAWWSLSGKIWEFFKRNPLPYRQRGSTPRAAGASSAMRLQPFFFWRQRKSRGDLRQSRG
jgi:polyhydroxybutyrate depolymerase